MPLWVWALFLAGASMAVLAIAAWALARRQPPERKALAARVVHLPWRAKGKLAWRLFRDPDVPLWLRAVVPALVLYLALPLDIIPDFIPVLGYLDDVLLLAVAAGVFLRFAPLNIVEAHVSRLEGGAGRGADS